MSQTDTSHNAAIDHLQKLHRRRMSLFGTVILIAGIAIGAASILILAPGEVMPPGIAFNRFSMPLLMSMERDLHLSPEQKEEIQPIISTHMETISRIHKDVQDQVSEQWTQMNDLIFAVLTEKQQEIWERRLDDVQRRLRGGPRQGGQWRGGGPGSHYRRGPGESDRYRKGPGSFGPGRPGDPNRPRNGFGQDPSSDRYRRGQGPFGPGRRPDDPNRSRNGFDRDAMQERMRREPGPYGPGPGRYPAGPNSPRNDPNQATRVIDE